MNPPAARTTLLVVDDDDARRTMLCTFFRHHGFNVEWLSDGRGLLDHVRQRCPDVILLDVMLPDQNGIDLCQQLRRSDALDATPVILITAACHDEDSIVTGLTCGADDYVIMPASLAEIHARVRVQLRNRRDRKLLQSTLAQRDRYMDEAYRDPLTQIGNRRACERAITGALHEKDAFLLMLIDIDHFKRINDSYGHPVGDEVLRSVASCLANLPRRGDFVGRYGGEEFAVVTRRTGRDVAQSIGDRFRQSVARMDLPETVPVRKVTVSIGISVWPDGRETSAAAGTGSGAGVLERLIKEADEALYAAKEGGRDRVVVAPYSGRPGTDDAPAPG